MYPIDILAEGLQFPEGPAFDAKGHLWLVELKGEGIAKYAGGQMERFRTEGSPNGIVIDAQDRIWFCDAGKKAIRRFDPENQQVETVVGKVDGQPLDKPNDLAFDPLGNLVFTCPGDSRQEPSGYVCVLQKNGTVKKITTGKYFPNGLAFSQDGKTLIIAETYQHRLWKGEWNAETCEWTKAKVWAAIEGGIGPDGMAFDTKGNLYVAVFGTGKLLVISPAGKIIEEMDLPGERPTNCAFDPTGRLGLVVTEAERGLLLSIQIGQSGASLFYPMLN
jgi:gluconolactonase